MPETHAGRLFDHVHLRVADLDASRRFYTAALGALGLEVRGTGSYFTSDELWVTSDGDPTASLHLAFQARDREAVQRFFDAALEGGGRENGRPGERDYHPGYYACYVLDPDG